MGASDRIGGPRPTLILNDGSGGLAGPGQNHAPFHQRPSFRPDWDHRLFRQQHPYWYEGT
jgi:hypothetical protein